MLRQTNLVDNVAVLTLPVLAHCAQLDQILDDIKCNLRKEQRTVMELSWITVHKVLTPIQVRARHRLVDACAVGSCLCIAHLDMLPCRTPNSLPRPLFNRVMPSDIMAGRDMVL